MTKPLRSIGKTGVHVFPVGLGAMPLSLRTRPPRQDAIEVIHAALNAGVNFIDTADVYCIDDGDIGHNERLIAEALKAWGRSEPVWVATKGGLMRPAGEWTTNGTPKHLRAACEKSLKALGVNEIFLYQLHSPDRRVPFADSVGELSRLKEEGKIIHIGLSNVDAAQINEAVQIVRVESVQNEFNPLCQRDLYNGVIDACAQLGLTYIAYSPVGGSGGHTALSQHKLLRELAAKYQATSHQIMVAFALQVAMHMLAIPGASKTQSILDSVGAAYIRIDDGDIARIRAIELSV
jgi:aryl-alcohol dehydrogenase-like predicted oxidoreductase